jgi:hypothetical protein
VAALKRAFPKNDPRPEQFRMLLGQFQIYHRTLFEWKELHNALDEILTKLEPFSTEVHRCDSQKTLPSPKTLRTLWRPVSEIVDILLQHAQQIEYIGKKFRNTGEHLVGEVWSVKIYDLRNQISGQIGLDGSAGFDLSIQRSVNVFDQGKLLIGLRPSWWIMLYEMHDEFYHVVYSQMHWADKKLRETATDLYNLSRATFGS